MSTEEAGVEVAAVELRLLGPDDWAAWRDIRLRALREARTAFGSTYEESLHPAWRFACRFIDCRNG